MQQGGGVLAPPMMPAFPNGNTSQPWHSEPDVPQIRQEVLQQIVNLLNQRKPGHQNQWQDKLTDFLTKLEDSLFHDAPSKEEYRNPATLETRLTLVARRLASKQAAAPGAAPQPGLNGVINMQAMQVAPQHQTPQFSMQQPPPQQQQQQQQQQAAGVALQPGQLNPGGVNPPLMQQQQMQYVPAPAGPQQLPARPALPGMVPLDAMNGTASYQPGLPGAAAPPPAGMIPTSHYGSSNPLMSNGAPVMLRQDQWGGNALTSPSMVPANMGNGAMAGQVPNMGMVPSGMGGPGGMPPAAPGYSVPAQPGSLPGQPGGMVPVNQMGGMVPVQNNLPGSSMVPMTAIGNAGGEATSAMTAPGGGSYPAAAGAVAPPGMVPTPNGFMGGAPSGPADPQLQKNIHDRQQYIQKQQRWLLFLRHCAKCQQNEQECQFNRSCRVGKDLWQHILKCSDQQCAYPRCISSKDLLKHHQKCSNPSCPICTPVKEYVRRTKTSQTAAPGTPPQPGGSNLTGDLAAMAQQSQLMVAQRQQNMLVSGQKRGMMPVSSTGTHLVAPTGIKTEAVAEADGSSSKRVKVEGHNSVLTKNTGASLLECFDAMEIREHVHLIRSAAQQQARGAPGSAAAAAEPVNPDDACKVCGQGRLLFEPPCLYCMQCGQRIKRGQTYHATPPTLELKACWCHGCFSEHKTDRIPYDGAQDGYLAKNAIVKLKNEQNMEEAWVQCDSCNAWVHQICGLFNRGRNDSDTHYLCPNCLIEGLETGQRKRIETRPMAMLEARDLPHCTLSRELEQRLNSALAQEQMERAAAQGKLPAETATATGLTVRVINNVIKKCEVKPKFLEAFQASEGYPEAFKYRQKVVVLFQKMDGVDVALYVMYVQEYGADCPAPNRNCVYLSYIDSVKYFRPEICTANGISLRTFVYHQILLGYLAYVRARGFEQLFIWACPPLAGDDYILYCHPSKQKTPRSDRLRAWYHDMLRKAKAEGTVAHVSTLWDTYFPNGRDHRLERCSITQIPYLDGDYWPGEAENLLASITDGQRAAAAKANAAAGSSGSSLQARKGGSKGKRYGGASTDEQLMSRLGDVLGGNMREDFMVVHLQEPCSICRTHVAGGQLHRYMLPNGGSGGVLALKAPQERKFEGIKLEVPNAPSQPSAPVAHFQICNECFTEEMTRKMGGARGRLPASVTLSELMSEQVLPVVGTSDTDLDIESEFFETRQAFLSLCQGNHYQFDTLRRAKHSSMMVVYHLHNPNAPAFAATCNRCQLEIEPGQGFRCPKCQDFDMCASCKGLGHTHEHPLVPHTNANLDETRMRLTEAERLERQQQLQKTLALLVHACTCNTPNCSSNSCRRVRQLFQHAASCETKVTGGCNLCKKMWCLLNLHAKSCTASDCAVPRCRELKDLRRRNMARMEQARRKAYAQMLRKQHGGGDGE